MSERSATIRSRASLPGQHVAGFLEHFSRDYARPPIPIFRVGPQADLLIFDRPQEARALPGIIGQPVDGRPNILLIALIFQQLL